VEAWGRLIGWRKPKTTTGGGESWRKQERLINRTLERGGGISREKTKDAYEGRTPVKEQKKHLHATEGKKKNAFAAAKKNKRTSPLQKKNPFPGSEKTFTHGGERRRKKFSAN